MVVLIEETAVLKPSSWRGLVELGCACNGSGPSPGRLDLELGGSQGSALILNRKVFRAGSGAGSFSCLA